MDTIFVNLLIAIIALVFLVMTTLYIGNLKRRIEHTSEELRRQHEWFRVALSSIGDGVVATDIEGRITFANPAAAELTGCAEAGMLGCTVTEVLQIMDEESGTPVEIPIERVLQENSIAKYSHPSVLVSKSGASYCITVSAAPIKSDAGEVIGVVMTFQDVTERIRNEKLQKVIYKIAESANRVTSLVSLFKYIHRALGSIINTQNFYIALCNDEHTEVSFPYYVDESYSEKGYRAYNARRFGKGMTEYVIRKGKPMIFNEKQIQALAQKGEIELIGSVSSYWLGVPLEVDKCIIGLMAVQSYSPSITYGKKDLDFMEYVSKQIAATIKRKRDEDLINHMAFYDALTDTPNRTLFNEKLNTALMNAQKMQQQLTVFFLDLDRFKVINDSHGHALGDRILQEAAKRLSSSLRKNDTIARLGGDEFTILLPEISSNKDAEKVALKILDSMREPFSLEDQEFSITTSIGIAVFPKDGEDAVTLLKNADIALYAAKESGRNAYRFYSAED